MTALDKASPASADETELACARPDPRALSLAIGGIRFTIASQCRDLLLDVPPPAHQFLVDSSANDESSGESSDGCTIEASWGTIPASAPGNLVFDSGGLWQQFSDGTGSRGTGHVFRFHSSFYGPLPYKECRVDADFRHARVVLSRDYLDCGQPVYPIEYPLDEILMVNLLSQSRGIDVHACGIEDSDGRGYLFLGQSGAGKTTTARLWDGVPGIRILSDDRIILRFVNGYLRMYGTPWHGEGRFASAPGARLDHIYFLGRGPMNEAVPMASIKTVARLMACSFVPFHDHAGLDFTLEFLQRLTRAVPVAELRFVPDGRVRDFIRNGNR